MHNSAPQQKSVRGRRLYFAALLSFASILLPAPFMKPPMAAELGVLAPVVVDGQPLMKRDSKNHAAPVVTRVTSGPLFDKLQKEAREGFTATVLKLDEMAQRRAGIAPVPTWLYLAVED